VQNIKDRSKPIWVYIFDRLNLFSIKLEGLILLLQFFLRFWTKIFDLHLHPYLLRFAIFCQNFWKNTTKNSIKSEDTP